MKVPYVALFYLLLFVQFPAAGQLNLGSAKSQINFREGPGLNFNVIHSIDHSNLLVILPGEPQNGFVEVFDIETSSHGFVYLTLIQVTDTLYYQKQFFTEKSGENAEGDIEVVLINRTSYQLYLWINNNSYDLYPHEKKVLILENEDITYFSSAPGLFPVFGKEILKTGSIYQWNFSL